MGIGERKRQKEEREMINKTGDEGGGTKELSRRASRKFNCDLKKGSILERETTHSRGD